MQAGGGGRIEGPGRFLGGEIGALGQFHLDGMNARAGLTIVPRGPATLEAAVGDPVVVRLPTEHCFEPRLQGRGTTGAIGGAQVSEKHSGFVINKGGATAADILNLIAAIQAGVRDQFGVELKTEVIVIGND